MTVYCGVEFHARVQTVSWMDTQDGEIKQKELNHGSDDIRGFYKQFAGEVIVGIEASGYSRLSVHCRKLSVHHQFEYMSCVPFVVLLTPSRHYLPTWRIAELMSREGQRARF